MRSWLSHWITSAAFSPEGRRDQCPEAPEGQQEEFGEKEQQSCGARDMGSGERRQQMSQVTRSSERPHHCVLGAKGMQPLPRGVGRTGERVSGLRAWLSQRVAAGDSARCLLISAQQQALCWQGIWRHPWRTFRRGKK